MREVRADFNDLSQRPELGLQGEVVPLGTEDTFPELAALRDGEEVLVVEPGEVSAEGMAMHIDAHGRRYWYAHKLRNIKSIYVEAQLG